MGKKLQKTNMADCNLLIAQDLRQARYQILSIIFLKQFIKPNVNTDTMIKKSETCGVEYKHCVLK